MTSSRFPFLLIFLLQFFSFNLKANNQLEQLTGSIIYFDQRNQTGDTSAEKAFDGDLGTYFKSDGDFGNWIGLDLGRYHIITSVEFYSRRDNKPEEYAERLELGIFEGANSPDFGDAVALGIISSPPKSGKNTINFACSKGFRYVRFVFPTNLHNGLSKYVGELRFFGYPGVGNHSQLPTLTNLPTINIHTVEAQDVTSKTTTIKGVISFVYENGTKFYVDSLDIRGRGNNSWTHPKKPYRLKLYKSVNLMGLPAKGKKWTLINNYGDKTLMRNILAFDFAKRLEMPYTSPAIAVDVVLNGDYKGCYQLCDQIDVRKNRIDVEEMSPFDLTGGYLVEIDAYASSEPKKFTTRNYNIPVTIKYPDDDDITREQETYISNHFNKLTDAVNASNFKDPYNGFRKYLDIETFIRHFLVGEYSGNTDTYWSVRMSKKRDEDKFVVGPVWDFDLAFENDHRTYPINHNTVYNYRNEWMAMWSGGTSAAGGTKDMLRKIFTDPAIPEKAKTVYAHYRDKNRISIDELHAVVDSCENLLMSSQELNFKRWNILNRKVHENPVIYGSYEGEVDNVRNYIADRLEWLDMKLEYEPNNSSLLAFSDESVTVRSEQNNLYIMGVPENAVLKIVDMVGHTHASVNNTSEAHFVLPKGVYLIYIKTAETEHVIKHMIR